MPVVLPVGVILNVRWPVLPANSTVPPSSSAAGGVMPNCEVTFWLPIVS